VEVPSGLEPKGSQVGSLQRLAHEGGVDRRKSIDVLAAAAMGRGDPAPSPDVSVRSVAHLFIEAERFVVFADALVEVRQSQVELGAVPSQKPRVGGVLNQSVVEDDNLIAVVLRAVEEPAPHELVDRGIDLPISGYGFEERDADATSDHRSRLQERHRVAWQE